MPASDFGSSRAHARSRRAGRSRDPAGSARARRRGSEVVCSIGLSTLERGRSSQGGRVVHAKMSSGASLRR